MPIDSIGTKPSPAMPKPVETTKAVSTEVATPATAPTAQASTEGYDDPKKKLMSVSGRYRTQPAVVSEREDLKSLVAAQRAAVNSSGGAIATASPEGGKGDRVGDNPGTISGAYHIPAEDAPRAKMDQKISLAPGDEKARRKFLNTFTQADPSRKALHNTHGCGAAVLLASALNQKDPKQPLGKLCDYMLSPQPDKILSEDRSQLEALKKRIDAGESITRGDLDFMQKCLYSTLNVAENSIPGANTNNADISIHAVNKVMTESGMGVSGGNPVLVDIDGAKDEDGNTRPDHFVLERAGIPGQIYDPWPRAGGNQVVTQGHGGIHDIGAFELYKGSRTDGVLPIGD